MQADGKLLVAGKFSDINGSPRQNIGRLNADGTLDNGFAVSSFDDDVSMMRLQPDGGMIVSGLFTMVNGVARNGIARFNGDGSLDQAFGTNAPSNDGLGPIALQPDGKIIIAGFDQLNGAPGNKVARLNADGSLDGSFNPGSGPDFAVSVLVQPDGKILLGGDFHEVNGVPSGVVARLNADGSLDSTFRPPAFEAGILVSLTLQPDGKLIVAGALGIYNNVNIVRLNPDGSADPGFVNDNGPDDYVEAVALQPNGQIVIGGKFSTVQGQPRRQLARLNADGSLDASFDAGAGGVTGTPAVSIDALAVQADGKIVAGGNFVFVNGAGHPSVARLLADGRLDASFEANIGDADRAGIASLAIQPDGKVLIGGDFSSINGRSDVGFARLAPDGGADETFVPGTGIATDQDAGYYPPPIVQSILVGPDKELILGGYFRYFDAVPRSNLARVNGDGKVDAKFAATTKIEGSGVSRQPYVHCSALLGDGKVIIGGEFLFINRVFVDHLARLNADGSLDPTFTVNVGGMANSFGLGLNAVVVQPDGKILVGGRFRFATGSPHSGIARLNADGTLDAGFDPGVGVDGYVAAVALQRDGKVVIGGFFGTVNGVASNNVARLNGDGSVDASFDPGVGAQDGGVETLAMQPDGRVLAGGGFSSFNGSPRQSLVRLNADGSVDTSFDPGSAAPAGGVAVLAVQPDGKVLAGAGSTLVRLTGDAPRPAFFHGEENVNNEYFQLAFPNGAAFGFYSYQSFPYLYHKDLGYEYFLDAQDGQGGAYLYDFKSGGFRYTSPSVFPYFYDFNAHAFIYYFPDLSRPGHYTKNPRVFVNLTTGKFIFD